MDERKRDFEGRYSANRTWGRCPGCAFSWGMISCAAVRSEEPFGLSQVEGIAAEGSGELDDLAVVNEGDSSLGLTNHRCAGPEDLAADTGADRIPQRGVQTGDLADRTSTLAPGGKCRKRPSR